MAKARPAVRHRTLRFQKLIHAPLPFVYAWCTDYREDDDRITDSIYHYRAKIVLREPQRVVRVITVPGRDRNRNTEVELIHLQPPNRWRLEKSSVTDDKSGSYRLTALGPTLTRLDMQFRERWQIRRPVDRRRYRTLFNRVWNRYVEVMEAEFQRRAKP